jgi:hypothetical protein
MPRSQLILLGCFAGTHKVAQRLRTLIRNPYRRQISGSIAACQLLSIPSIRLDPITRFNRYQRGCHYLALNAQLRQLPVHDVACRSRFIAGSYLLCRAKLLDQLAHRLDAVRNRSQASHLAIRLRNRYGNRLGMDIQP